jgi:hypothetical protein
LDTLAFSKTNGEIFICLNSEAGKIMKHLRGALPFSMGLKNFKEKAPPCMRRP